MKMFTITLVNGRRYGEFVDEESAISTLQIAGYKENSRDKFWRRKKPDSLARMTMFDKPSPMCKLPGMREENTIDFSIPRRTRRKNK